MRVKMAEILSHTMDWRVGCRLAEAVGMTVDEFAELIMSIVKEGGGDD